MELYEVEYLSSCSVNKRLTNPMIPWIIAEIKKNNYHQQVRIGIEDVSLVVYENWDGKKKLLFQHELKNITRLAFLNSNVSTFFYAVRDISDENNVNCHVYCTTQPDEVMELFSTMKENSHKSLQNIGRSLSNAQTLTSLCADISPNSSHFFEVLYIGKIRVSQKKVPSSFIDDALEKFRLHELEKRKKSSSTNSSRRGSQNLDKNTPYLTDSRRGSITVLSPGVENQSYCFGTDQQNKDSERIVRTRSGSINYPIKKLEINEHSSNATEEINRTMVFQIGRSDLRLISPDRKQILLHKQLKDIINCVQGARNQLHFGFTCKDSSSNETCIGYIFKCESESVASELVTAINLAFNNTNEALKKEKQVIVSCEHCPMVWFHKLCSDIENLNEHKIQTVIFKQLETLPEDDQEIVLTKLHGLETLSKISLKEQNELLIMLLRTHCESKQMRHVHDSAENRHEFLNQYLGGSTIFMKAKRSLTSSFDQLMKRRSSRDDIGLMAATKENSLPNSATFSKEPSPKSDLSSQIMTQQSVSNSKLQTSKSEVYLAQTKSHSSPASMMNMFLKVGQSQKSPSTISNSDNDSDEQNDINPGSWRQAIFKNVVTPNKQMRENQMNRKKLDPADLRALWKKAINQQVLLIRMEKENAKLKERQEEATVKRIKLEYDDIGSSAREYLGVWETIVNKENRKYDAKMLRQAVRQGVPRSKRGDVWIFFAELYCNTTAPSPIDLEKFPNFNVPYEQLLKQLTKHQHAILIDLGRTFPNHTYFMSPFGPGQLALYNMLKAYSLLDPEVGYCQGLCFIAGVLLLHMSEEQAYLMLKHLMFRRSLRKQYLPDMAALQVQLYQLSRLLHDYHPDLYAHFDNCDIPPTLYAAPWFLTMFASQFPLGFVARIFDILFFENVDILFRIILSLLTYHKDNLLACDGMEQIMNYIKHDLPIVNKEIIDKIIKQVFTTDISKQLMEYGVEYHVLQEELSSPNPEIKKVKHLEEMNKTLMQQNKILHEQLEISITNNGRLEMNRSSNLSVINRLESEVKSLELTVATLGNFISEIAYTHSDIEIPPDVLGLIAQINMCRNRQNINKQPNINKLFSKPQSEIPYKIRPLLEKSLSDSKNLSNKSIKEEINQEDDTKEKNSLNNFELFASNSNNSNSSLNNNGLHPLDCKDVNIRYSGSAELRTIKPIRSNSDSNFILPNIIAVDIDSYKRDNNDNIQLNISTINRS